MNYAFIESAVNKFNKSWQNEKPNNVTVSIKTPIGEISEEYITMPSFNMSLVRTAGSDDMCGVLCITLDHTNVNINITKEMNNVYITKTIDLYEAEEYYPIFLFDIDGLFIISITTSTEPIL